MISRALADEELPVYGNGENVRDWLHVSDHCEAIDLIIHKGKVGEVYKHWRTQRENKPSGSTDHPESSGQTGISDQIRKRPPGP